MRRQVALYIYITVRHATLSYFSFNASGSSLWPYTNKLKIFIIYKKGIRVKARKVGAGSKYDIGVHLRRISCFAKFAVSH